jgi:hypothetical protein
MQHHKIGRKKKTREREREKERRRDGESCTKFSLNGPKV